MALASNPTLIVGVVLGALLLLLLGAYAISSRRVGRKPPPSGRPAGWITTLQGSSELKEGEVLASPAAEAIEDLAQAKLAQYADLTGLRLDFGTGLSGDLEIWIGSDRYSSVDDIPDDRIRQAIGQAVEEFNRGQSQAGMG